MNLLIATPLYPPDIGGPATYANILADELPKRGVSVQIISFGTVRHLPKGIAHIVYAIKLFRAIRGADLLLALDPVSVGFPAALAAILCRKKLIVRVAGDYAWEQGKQRFGVTENLDEFLQRSSNDVSFPIKALRNVQTFVAHHAQRIIVPSKYLKDSVLLWGIPPAKMVVVYNAFDPPAVLPAREALRKNFGFSGPILFSAGRLVPWKGFSALISLMPELQKTHPDIKFFIAGPGPLGEELKKQIRAAHLESVVTMLGDVPHLKLMEYIRAADCFVLNTGYEGFSHQLLEVLAIGTPIVTTTVGGNRELVANGATGRMVDYNDQVALSGAILDVFEKPDEAEMMARAGQRFAANFTVDRMVKETLEVCKKVIQQT